jgi:hypothetical protein
MDWLGERLSHINATLDYQDLLNHGDDFKKLLDLEIIKYFQQIESIPCEWCEQTHPISPFLNKDGDIVLSCSGNRRVMKPDELKIWEIDTPRLLSLFQQAIGIKAPKAEANIAELLWDFGTQEVNGATYHLFFSKNIDEVEKSKLSIVTALPHSVVFYTGTPHTSLPDRVLLVPFMDLIKDMDDNGPSINKELLKQYFPSGVYSTKDGDIELDENLVLQGQYLLFGRERGGVFKKRSAKIRPLAKRIMEHLYTIRHYDVNAKTLDELAAALGSSKVSISNEIGRVNKICTDNNLQEILHKYSDEKWGINPSLSSCK